MSTLKNKRIVLGVTGSIAAYKAADITSKLSQMGANVHVVLTHNASHFVGEAVFQALSGNPVLKDIFDEPGGRRISHIDLAQKSDLILVAPATGNILAKMAVGLADDLLSTILLAASVPVLMAPAMNTNMWRNPATLQNVKTLRNRGILFVEPAQGLLACGDIGPGKLADVSEILVMVETILLKEKDMAGMRVIITAGATREPIDPVRFISNRSSGKMGHALAQAAHNRGADVTIVQGVVHSHAPDGVKVIPVETTEEMLQACMGVFSACDALISAGAPVDYAPINIASEKLKKNNIGGQMQLTLQATPDILLSLARIKKTQVMVGFAAETDRLIENAQKKLAEKSLDMIVANDITLPGAGFDTDTNIVTLLFSDGRQISLPAMSKGSVADNILDEVVKIHIG
jgi:phosphopantothenoylcysteine decarboxylase/phosphopantothenate--cysteine ligase